MLDPEIQKVLDNHLKVEAESKNSSDFIFEMFQHVNNVYLAGAGLPIQPIIKREKQDE